MEVGLDDEFDREPQLLGVGQILGHVTLRVDNDCAPGGFVAYQIRRVRQAVQVVLDEFHGSSFSVRLWVMPSCLYPYGYVKYPRGYKYSRGCGYPWGYV